MLQLCDAVVGEKLECGDLSNLSPVWAVRGETDHGAVITEKVERSCSRTAGEGSVVG